MFAFMPASATAATVSAGKKYISEKLVVPLASISRMARRLPAAMSSGTNRSSMGKTLSNSHSRKGRPLPTPRSSTMGE